MSTLSAINPKSGSSVLASLGEHTRFSGDKKDYKDTLSDLQKSLLQVLNAYYHQKQRAVIVFEGWDASGKGGSIRRVTERLDPRSYRVYPIDAPTPTEQGKHYLYRFFTKLPKPGCWSIFDRSYYGRVLVERVEGFARDDEWQRAYNEINQFEKLLTDDGVRVIKLFLHITPQEQLKRFEERLNNPVKRWKLGEEDLRNRSRWNEYEHAIEDMFTLTHTDYAPWFALAANNKWHTRLQVLRILIQELSKDIDLSPPPIDIELLKKAKQQLGISIDNHLDESRD